MRVTPRRLSRARRAAASAAVNFGSPLAARSLRRCAPDLGLYGITTPVRGVSGGGGCTPSPHRPGRSRRGLFEHSTVICSADVAADCGDPGGLEDGHGRARNGIIDDHLFFLAFARHAGQADWSPAYMS